MPIVAFGSSSSDWQRAASAGGFMLVGFLGENPTNESARLWLRPAVPRAPDILRAVDQRHGWVASTPRRPGPDPCMPRGRRPPDGAGGGAHRRAYHASHGRIVR